jgi:rhodanese-related sulfurtransferase
MKKFWWLPAGKESEVTPEQLHQWLDEGQLVQLVDARTDIEFRSGTIGQAQHAPLIGMPGSLERVPLDPALPVVVLCLSGHRSLPGTRWLRAHGYEAYSLQGGIMNWTRKGYPLTR